ncbi:disease resistance protein RPV1-like [Diospyros lotus]|uniref:disease resistance protein RPV1-like n=1 Tax=Diospyros lotus TaxID=55363 RepID=UPI00225BFC81|nr:disease resistance protein RPV1-like [Diospyros lotus]
MASTSTQLQYGASLPSGSSSRKYDVFLSFRGTDTRNGFVDHLYSALHQKGIFTFKDDLKLERGESISPALLKAIEQSRLTVVIFSENYASSKWCLEELVQILECQKTRGLTVLPVFYKVDPSDLRKQRGSVGEAFARHERDSSEEKEKQKVKRWRNALREAANISGWDSENGTTQGLEAKLVREIVKDILNKLGDKDSIILDYVVGLDPRVAEVKSLLGLGLDDSRIVGISGMGGIGKTIIAKAVYNQIRSQFDGSSYLANVRETSKKHGLEYLQQLLLSDILLDSDIKISNLDRGLSMIMNRVQYMRVLVVLDDVDRLKQLEALVGKLDWFGSGSRIIITTRDTHLLNNYEVDHVYKVKELNNEEAVKLFCCKAFRKNQPTEGYERLTNSVVSYAKGVPLALRVLGSFLFGRSIIEWQSAIDRIRQQPNAEIQEVLKLSYDGLNHEEKEIFLDIACFFKGESKDYIIDILDACGFCTHIGIRILVDKSLITILNNKIDMHDLIQEMGWHIVNEESPKEPGRRSRLWYHSDIHHVLEKNTGTEAIEGIILASSQTKEMSLNPGTFSKMSKLRLLVVHNIQLPHGLDYLSNELSLLDWHGYPLKLMPSSFQPNRLVELKMRCGCLQQLWKGTMSLERLKYIDLSYSLYITKTPDFTQVVNLEKLILEGCMNLVEIGPSIGAIKRLAFLNLKDCKYLKVLPTSSWLKSLQNLVLSGCSKLKNISQVLACTKCLIELYLDGTCIMELPVEHLNNLVCLSLRDCKKLASLPSGTCGLKFLKTLILSGCSNLNKLPQNLGELESLEELRADLTAIKQTPSSIIFPRNLKFLSFRGCKGETSTLWNSMFSTFLFPRKCQDPIGLALPPLSGLRSLKELDLSDCNISEGFLPNDLGSLSSLEYLMLRGNSFMSLSASISGLSRLISLELSDCKMLKTLPELPSSLVSIDADDCTSLERLPNLTACEKLQDFTLSNCRMLAKNQPSNNHLALELFRIQLEGFATSRTADYTIVVPGRELPGYFSYQNNMGDTVRIPLMPGWNVKLKGFVVCAVLEVKAPTRAKVRMDYYWLSNDVKVMSTDNEFGSYTGRYFDSYHLLLQYIPFQLFFYEELKDEFHTWTEFVAYFSSNSPKILAPVKCAAYLLYEKDTEWIGPRSIQQADSELSVTSTEVMQRCYTEKEEMTP